MHGVRYSYVTCARKGQGGPICACRVCVCACAPTDRAYTVPLYSLYSLGLTVLDARPRAAIRRTLLTRTDPTPARYVAWSIRRVLAMRGETVYTLRRPSCGSASWRCRTARPRLVRRRLPCVARPPCPVCRSDTRGHVACPCDEAECQVPVCVSPAG